MVSAEFTYREFTPRGELPNDMTQVTFWGSEEMNEALDTLRNLVQFDRSSLSDYEIGLINDIRRGLQEELAVIQQQMADIKKSNRFMMIRKGDAYIEYKELDKQRGSLLEKDTLLVDKIDALDEDRFYGQKELADKFRTMLTALGFQFDSTRTDNRGIRREIHGNPMSDDELLPLVNGMTTNIQEQIKARKLELLVKYGVPTQGKVAGQEMDNDDTTTEFVDEGM